MASIEKRSENSYRITVSAGYNSDNKQIKKQKTVRLDPTLTPKQAEKELQRLVVEFERQVQTGQILEGGQLTLSEFVERWLKDAENRLEAKTIDSYKAELDSKILPALGHLKLDKIRPLHLQEFYNNLLEDGIRQDGKAGGYSSRTIKYQHQILSSLLGSAVQWQLILSNPCSRIKPPKGKEEQIDKVKNFNEEQTVAFLEAVEKEAELKYQAAANIAVFAGLRKGEVLGLTWDDIDFDNCTIRVSKAHGYVSGSGLFTKTPKNKTSVRTVTVPESVIKLLGKYKAWQAEQKLKCGDSWNKDWEKHKLLFTTWNGKPMDYDTLQQWLSKFINHYNDSIKADDKIKDEDKEKFMLPKIPFHGLRHTSATLMIANNVDIRTAAGRLGHSKPTVTLGIYAHALKSADEKAANTLDGVLNKKKTSPDSKQA